MLDHVFTDAIGALRDAVETACLERQAFEERFQADVLLGDLTWETSYSLPGEGLPPRSAGRHHARLADVGADLVSVLVHRRAVRRAARASRSRSCSGCSAWRRRPIPHRCSPSCPSRAPRSAPSVSTARARPSRPATLSTLEEIEYAVEVSYEGTYELEEAMLQDGSKLDEHFGAMGGWIASTLVRLGDLKFDFLPARRRGRCVPCPTSVLLDVSDRIATVTLNRPEARNALSGEVLRQLRSTGPPSRGRRRRRRRSS